MKDKNILFIKNFDANNLAKLDSVSQENYKLLKEDTENFTDFSIFDIVPDAEATLESWIKTVKGTIKEVEKHTAVPKTTTLKVSKPVNEETKTEINKTVKVSKIKASKKTKDEQEEELRITKQNLRNEIKQMLEQVKENALFKENIAIELSNYLQKNQTGLGASKDDELTKLKTKHKFYKKLLENDTADFKAIAKRVGLYYTISKPRTKKKKGLSGTKKQKSLKDKILDFFSI